MSQLKQRAGWRSAFRRSLGHFLAWGGGFFLAWAIALYGGLGWPGSAWVVRSAAAALGVTLAHELRSQLRGRQTWAKLGLDLASKALGLAAGVAAVILWWS